MTVDGAEVAPVDQAQAVATLRDDGFIVAVGPFVECEYSRSPMPPYLEEWKGKSG